MTIGSRVARAWLIVIALGATFVANDATAIIANPQCLYAGELSVGTNFLARPIHLQPTDSLPFHVGVWLYYASQSVALSKTTFDSSTQIRIDVVVTVATGSFLFPDYRMSQVSNPGSALAAIDATFDHLPVGQYAVTTTLRLYDPATGVSDPCGTKKVGFTIFPDDGLSPVVEYYDAKHDHYFLTQSADEIAALDAPGSGWVRTGESFLAYRPMQNGGAPVFRYYGRPGAGLDTHLFILEDDVADFMAIFMTPFDTVWHLETDDAFNLDFPTAALNGVNLPGGCPAGEVPVYRLWNGRADSDHRYTTNPEIKAQMIAKGYIAEGYGPDAIMMCAYTRQ